METKNIHSFVCFSPSVTSFFKVISLDGLSSSVVEIEKMTFKLRSHDCLYLV